MGVFCAHTDDKAIALACSGVRTESVAQPARKNNRRKLSRRTSYRRLLDQLHDGADIRRDCVSASGRPQESATHFTKTVSTPSRSAMAEPPDMALDKVEG